MHAFVFHKKSRVWPSSVSFVIFSDLTTRVCFDSSFWKCLEIFSSEISDHRISFITSSLFLELCVFMAMIDLRIYRGFYRENRSQCNFTPSVPSVIIHGEIPYKFSNLFSP